MKNILKLGLIALTLFVAAPASAESCRPCNKPRRGCEAPCNKPACKLPAPGCTTIERTTTCGGTPEYHWVCSKVYHPCNEKVSVSKAVVKERCVGVEVEGQAMPYSEASEMRSPKKHGKRKHQKKEFSF